MESAVNEQVGPGPRILIIEDEQGLLDILTVNLESAGYEVVTAQDGLIGWQAFEQTCPDLILLDVNLPKISGFRLLELFRNSDRPHVPVVALTALDFGEAEELAQRGLNAFISKPFRPAEVVRIVLDVLGRPSVPVAEEPDASSA